MPKLKNKTDFTNKRLQQIAKSSLYIFLGVIISNIASYVYRLAIARNFGPEFYGIFSLALMVTGIFVSLFSLGLADSTVRFIPRFLGSKSHDKIRFIMDYFFKFLLIANIIAAIILYFTSEIISIGIFHQPLLIVPLKIFSILIPIWIFLNLYSGYLICFERSIYYTIVTNVLPSIIRLLLFFLLIFIGIGTNSIFISYAFGTLIVLLIALYLNKKLIILKTKKAVSQKEKSLIKKEVWKYALPIIFSAAIAKIYVWTDSFMIGYYLDAIQVGIYNAATPIALLLSITPQLFLQLFVPIINKETSNGNKSLIKQISQQVGKWIFIINLPILLFIIVFPSAIVNVLFGIEYTAAADSLRILSIGAFISSISMVSEKLILMIGKSKLIMKNIIFTSIINIILNMLLIPRLGIVGAAISTSVVWILMSFMLLYQAHISLSIIPIRKKMIKIALISIIPFIVLVIIKNIIPYNFLNLILLSFSFLLLYLLLLFLTNCLDKYDIAVLKNFKSKIKI